MKLDDVIGAVSPKWALKRAQARHALRLYDAAQASDYHRPVRGAGYSGNAVMQNARSKLRARTRDLDENHDLAINILNVLCDNIVGAGIHVEPMVKFSTGKRVLHEKLNMELKTLWTDFWKRPEATGLMPGTEVERIACRSWLRDGEILTQHLEGSVPGLDHLHRVPYTLELIEADLLPFDALHNLGETEGQVVHGVELNDFGRPIRYHLYLTHPGDIGLLRQFNLTTRPIQADKIIHLKYTRRIGQVRGVPVLHGVIQRLSDVYDYEESERIAAKVAASFTGFIKKAIDSEANSADASTGKRTMEMSSGMIWDGLLPGEEIGTIASDRPNTGLEAFRNGQLRAAAGGAGATYSSVSKDYSGNYSSQRQEMVEGRVGYQRMQGYFIEQFMLPVWARFVAMAELAGEIRIPSNVDRDTLLLPSMRGPVAPWIDPDKESKADERALKNRFKSRQQIIRERNGDPAQVDAEIETDPLLESIPDATAKEPEAEAPAKEPDDIDETDEDEQNAA